MSEPRPTILRRCWNEHGRIMWLLAGGLLVAGVLANPRFLKIAKLITYKTSAPKSGFWVASVICLALGLLLLLGRRYRVAGKLLLSTIVVALMLLVVDVVLRINPPVEVTIQPNWPKGNENAWGFLDQPPRPEAAQRVLVLGDSIEFGWGDGVTTENRYHDLVEQSLQAEGLDVDVQHTALPDRQLDYYLEQYETFAPEYDPQLVLVGWCFNDINYGKETVNVAGNIEHGAEPTLERIRNFVGYPFKRWSLNEWYLGTVISKRASIYLKNWGLVEGDWIDDHNTEYHSFLQRLWANEELRANVQRDLARLRDDCRQHDRELLVVIFPYRFHVTKEDTAEIDQIKSILAALQIRAVDLYPAYLAGQAEEDLYSKRDECHPTARGHRIAAEVVLPVVREMLSDASQPAPAADKVAPPSS